MQTAEGYLVIIASRLRRAADRDRFLELSRGTHAWLAAREGFLRYELYETPDGWMDTMLWATVDDAAAGNRAFQETSLSRAFAEIVDPSYLGLGGSRIALG